MVETTTTPAVEQPAWASNYDENFSKLDAILDKRADDLAKFVLKDNGIEKGEISDIVKQDVQQKKEKSREEVPKRIGV